MKIFPYAVFLIIGTVLLTFAVLSFILFPRSFSINNADLLVEALFVAGIFVLGLGARGLYHITKFAAKPITD
jgi:hypothetical protein